MGVAVAFGVGKREEAILPPPLEASGISTGDSEKKGIPKLELERPCMMTYSSGAKIAKIKSHTLDAVVSSEFMSRIARNIDSTSTPKYIMDTMVFKV